MIRKFYRGVFSVFLFCLLSYPVLAQEVGRVILDLREDETAADAGSVLTDVIQIGKNFVDDVKLYDEQLEGDAIHKNFSADIRSKYPQYNEEKATKWQEYVRTGVGGYRLYKAIKQKVMDWLLEKDIPIVVDDDQYEMGEAEEYIESDKPVVIQKFRKVVAYADNERDQKAAREKIAKDHHLPSPSQTLQKYKTALLKKDWKTLFGFDWKKYLEEVYPTPQGKEDLRNEKMVSFMMPQFDGIGKDGKFFGVISVLPQKQHLVLLQDYQDYKGINIDFSESDNVENIVVQFIWPQQFKINQLSQVLGYGSVFPIYFQGKALDATQKVVLKPKINAAVCQKDKCTQVETLPELVLEPKENIRQSAYASYVQTVAQNVPRQNNKEKFDFKELVVEEPTETEPKQLRLRLKTDHALRFKVMMIGDNAKYFSLPSLQLDGKEVTARFKLLDENFDPEGQIYTFWVSTGMTSQYLKTMKAKKVSGIDTRGTIFSFGLFGLAILGGFLLNFMPCVFPVLSLKLLALTRFGGQNVKQVQSNFFYNCVGIATAFVLIAVGLSVLKVSGQAIGWGMQFQNVYFLVLMIWTVTLFLAHILGFVNLRTPAFADRILKQTETKGRLFEFLSGVFLVLLSTPCMAPYLGTAFGVALAGSIRDIWMAVIGVGMGVALPYLLFAVYPKLAFYVPKPGQWLDFINLMMFLMLVITLGWLVSVLAAQSGAKELWHWALYIFGVLVLLFFRHIFKIEVDKLENTQVIPILQRRTEVFFGTLLFLIVAFSLFDARQAFYQQRKTVETQTQTLISKEEIARIVELGGKVLVKVGADWCLTCSYNNAFVFDVDYIQDALENHDVVVFDIDWTHYDEDVLQFMHSYGRQGLPFYVFFSPRFPKGIVLPEMPDASDFQSLIEM